MGDLTPTEEKVLLSKRAPAMDPEKKAAHLRLHMSDFARKVCLPVGWGRIDNLDGLDQILKILRERFAPDAVDLISQDMAKFWYFERTDQKIWTRTSWSLKCSEKERSQE